MDYYGYLHIETQSDIIKEELDTFFEEQFVNIPILEDFDFIHIYKEDFSNSTIMRFEYNEVVYLFSIYISNTNVFCFSSYSRESNDFVVQNSKYLADWFYDNLNDVSIIVTTWDGPQDSEDVIEAAKTNDQKKMKEHEIDYVKGIVVRE